MNICLLNLDYTPFRTAGLTVYGELLAGGLQAAGHRVTVVASRRQQAPLEEVIEGIRVLRVPIGPADWLGFGYQSARLLDKLERTEPFDVVHFLDVRFAWRYRGDCVASLFESFRQRLHAKGDRPYAHNLANFLFRYTYFVLVNRTLQRWAVAHPRLMIAASESTREEFIRHYSIPPERIALVPLGIDVEHYRPRDGSALRKSLGLEGKRVILYVGFSTPRKGVEYIAQALAELGPDCFLLLVGRWEPGYRAKFYRSLPAGVGDRIVEAGYVSDESLPLYYSMADVFVFPSLLEGFGLPVVEAMACGTPVVAASSSSLPEVVGDAGLLVPAMDAQALADALQTLLTDEELRSTLAERGLERARSVYDKRDMVAGTLKVYQAYLNQK
jgi:glycosyltransferase involved in cell wall biosynthesis